jgi:hypothetical protein
MDITQEITTYSNVCFICGKSRAYKTKQGLKKANEKKSSCISCRNSIKNGGKGNLYNNKNERFCSSCHTFLDVSNFYKHRNGMYHSYCIKCKLIKSNEYHSKIHRFKKYNISKEDFDLLLQNQKGLCGICNEHLIDPQIDHDHTNGKIRGLLCRKCNIALGLFKDNQEILKNAINYLKNDE